jgi:hypothetical protein
MKLFDKYGYKFTLWMVARSAEVTGFYPRLLAEKGHEVGPRRGAACGVVWASATTASACSAAGLGSGFGTALGFGSGHGCC